MVDYIIHHRELGKKGKGYDHQQRDATLNRAPPRGATLNRGEYHGPHEENPQHRDGALHKPDGRKAEDEKD